MSAGLTRIGANPWLPVRLAVALPAAAVVTLGLLWGMQYLVSTGRPMSAEPSGPAMLLDFVRIKREPPPEPRKQERPQRPQPAQTPPPEPPPPALQPTASGDGTITVSAPRVATNINLSHAGFSISNSDGNYLPIFKVAPNYPLQALRRGIEGYCIVQYTVTAQGAVRDVRVLEGQCTNKLFREPSIQASLKFKYKPRIVDGAAIEVTGVRNRFVYRLEEAP